MKNSIYLVMNYWPKEDYWLCSEFYKRHITYRLIGIDSKVRKLRYAKMGGGIWKILRFAHAIKVAVNSRPLKFYYCLIVNKLMCHLL